MPATIWCIYRVDNCRHTHPPKFKYVFIVCRDEYCRGFLVNHAINKFISARPHLLECQILLKQSDYGFLVRDSYLDCHHLCDFTDDELMIGIGPIRDATKAEIKAVVSKAKTIEKRHRNLILNS